MASECKIKDNFIQLNSNSFKFSYFNRKNEGKEMFCVCI